MSALLPPRRIVGGSPHEGSRDPGPLRGLVLYGAITFAFLAASAAPTPLYALYQESWGLSPITLTVIYASYPLALMLALLTLGSLSGALGRRRVVLAAIALQAVAMGVFLLAPNASVLILARVLQGVATGTATAAFAAALVDLDRLRGAFVNSLAPLLGMAFGALGSGAIATFAPTPASTVFLTLLVIFCALLATGGLLPETHQPQPGARASLAIRLRVPAAARRAVWSTAPILIAVWSIGGFVLSLGPHLAADLSGSDDPLLGGLLVLLLTGAGALAVLLHRTHPASPVLLAGSASLVLGGAATMAAEATRSPMLLLLGTVVAGYGFGAAFQGALQTILPLAAAHERSELTSAVYVICYLANAIPALGAGVLTSLFGLRTAVYAVGGLVVALSLVGLAAALVRSRSHSLPTAIDPVLPSDAACPQGS